MVSRGVYDLIPRLLRPLFFMDSFAIPDRASDEGLDVERIAGGGSRFSRPAPHRVGGRGEPREHLARLDPLSWATRWPLDRSIVFDRMHSLAGGPRGADRGLSLGLPQQ